MELEQGDKTVFLVGLDLSHSVGSSDPAVALARAGTGSVCRQRSMPRRRPGRIRVGDPGNHRTTGARPVIDGLSSRALCEIIRLERSRNYLQPGDISTAVGLWRDYVHQSERALLDTAMQALSPRSARELRKIVSRADALWALPSPPYETDGRQGTG